MDYSTASSAIMTLSNMNTKSFKSGPFQSYFAGHDDKHRSMNKAYGYNHISSTGDEPASCYQVKTGTTKVGTGQFEEKTVEVFHGWGKPRTTGTQKFEIMRDVGVYGDLTVDDEVTLLQRGVSSSSFGLHPNDQTSFRFTCAIPSGYKGYTFSGGGKRFPKKPEEVDRMVLVISPSSNIQLITHYPASSTDIARWGTF